jgi:Transcription-silencing protein, cryptic loci regulator Clr2/Transcription-silencing protein Clr2
VYFYTLKLISSGSKTVLRFRSPAEFIPHGVWLLTDPTLNKSNCGCKYCGGGGKKSQTEISVALGLPTNRGATAVTGASKRMRIGVQRASKFTKTREITALPADTPWVPYESRTDRKTDPAWRTLSLKLKYAANIMRISDLRSDRRFRVGELVWCKWEDGANNRSLGQGATRFPPLWPAIVLEYLLKSVADVPSSNHESYSVHHKRRYSLLCLGSSSEDLRLKFECILDEDDILPWQTHLASALSWPFLRDVNDMPDGQFDHFTFALGTATRLAGFWAVCNRIPVKVASGSVSRDPPKTENNTSCSQVFQRVSTPDHHSNDARSMPSLAVPHPSDSPPQRSPTRLKPMSPMKRNRTPGNILTEQKHSAASVDNSSTLEQPQPLQSSRVAQSKATTITETRYEGLWYGAERIWTGDVVRLCPGRDAFAESLRMSHMKDDHWQQKTTPSPGAAMRGVLMRVDRIFARVGDKGLKECAIAGPLYELAPKDWAEAAGSSNDVSPSCHPSGSSPVSCSDDVYYPWDMPQIPPRVKLANHSTRLPSYPLPPAPPGYALRALLPPQSEITFPASFIAGRYYPSVLQWPLSLSLATVVEMRGVALEALCGLAPGKVNQAVCVDIRLSSRTRMVEEAACLAGSRDTNLNVVEVDGR